MQAIKHYMHYVNFIDIVSETNYFMSLIINKSPKKHITNNTHIRISVQTMYFISKSTLRLTKPVKKYKVHPRKKLRYFSVCTTSFLQGLGTQTRELDHHGSGILNVYASVTGRSSDRVDSIQTSVYCSYYRASAIINFNPVSYLLDFYKSRQC